MAPEVRLQAKWVFLRVNSRTSVAFRVEEVHRVLHRKSGDYGAHLPESKSLADFLGVSPDDSLPGVLAVLSQGDVWEAGDAHILGAAAGTSYISIGRNLFEDTDSDGMPDWWEEMFFDADVNPEVNFDVISL